MCWVLSVDFFSYGRRFCCVQEPASCAQVRLFAFPPPLVGLELGRERGGCSFCKCFCKAADLKLL
jgi:hypothetical protein